MNNNTYYKYKFGYINIDQNNIYLTSTGNWSEVAQLTEKTFGKTKKKIGKVISIYFFLSIVLLAMLGSFILNDKSVLLKIGSLLVGIAGFYRLKRYFDTETGQRFFIPKNKIIDIEIDRDLIKLKFKTIEDALDEIVIHKLEGNLENFKAEIRTINL